MDLTIISPCFNESKNLIELVERTQRTINDFNPSLDFEHILIDNASTDDSKIIFSQILQKYSHVRILQNSENIGVFSSIQRAMKESKGTWLVPFLASDMQDPPEVIFEFLKIQKETNCDAVFGVRKKRQEAKFLIFLRALFYFILKQFISGKKYISGTSEFCLIKRNITLSVIENDDPNPFLRIYLSKLTKNIKYVEFKMVQRSKGKSSANLFTLLDDALNAFSIIMPSVFSRLILILMPFSFLITIFFVTSLVLWSFNLINYFYLLMSLILLLFSVLFFIQLVIGHYIFILHSQIRKKPVVQTLELER